MNRLSEYVFAIVIAGAATAIFATVAIHRAYVVDGQVNTQTDAAFRDGLFLARFDAEHGRKPRLTSGRWSADADRRSFVSGYLQAYREKQGGAASEEMGSAQLAAQRGYRDGVTDGLQQRYRSKSFRVNATKKYQKADRGYSDNSGDLNEYRQAYREAYCNGYQQAYYGEAENVNIEEAIFSEAKAPE